MKAQKQAVTGGPERGRNQKKVLLTLVVPTRNEAENVPMLVHELRESLSDLDYRVVFVDDSTDETPEVIRGLAEQDGRILLVRREGAERYGGLSTAVTTGMELFSGASEYTCVMDADLQHPPEKVRQMLEIARRSDADVVVASRYAPGGSYAGLSGRMRRAVSVGSRFPATLRRGIQGDHLPGLRVPGPHTEPLLVRALGGALMEVPPSGGLGRAGQHGHPHRARRVLRRQQGHSLDVRGRDLHPQQLPPQQRVHLARYQALEQDPLLPARRPGLSRGRHGHRGEFRRLVPAGEVCLRRLSVLRTVQPTRHSGRHERELHPLLPTRVPSL